MNPYPIGEIVGIEVYRNDVIVKREGGVGGPGQETRGNVTMFSQKSRQRLAFIAANTDVVFTTMLTLTYPGEYPHDGRQVKKHFRAMLQALRRRGCEVSYLWFIEFQRRGAPHYHVLLTGIPATDENRQWVSKRWYEIVDSGDERHLRAGTRLERVREKEGARKYAVKYAYKMRQKRVPEKYRNVGRFWGHSRDVKPSPRSSIECNHDDVVAGLEMGGWEWLRGATIWYKVLYGAADVLTRHFVCDTLSPSESERADSQTRKDGG